MNLMVPTRRAEWLHLRYFLDQKCRILVKFGTTGPVATDFVNRMNDNTGEGSEKAINP